MRLIRLAAGTLILTGAACAHRSAHAPAPVASNVEDRGPSPSFEAPVSRTVTYRPSAQEEQLLRRLESVTAPALAAGLRKALSNPAMVATVRDNPAAQSIIDTIMTLREKSLSASVAGTAQTGPLSTNINSSVLIALVDRLQDSTASAMIIRRPDRLPHDVILLRRSDATTAELGGAMRTLADIQEREGQVPMQEKLISAHDVTMPSRWKTDGTEAMANSTLAALRAAPEEEIAGLGRASAMSLVMGRQPKVR